MRRSEEAWQDQRQTAALMGWTRDQLSWLCDDGYTEVHARSMRSHFAVLYLKPRIAVVEISQDRGRGEADIGLGPDNGDDPHKASLISVRMLLATRGVDIPPVRHGGGVEASRNALRVLLDALESCRAIELAGKWDNFAEAREIAKARRDAHLERLRSLDPMFDVVVDQLRGKRPTDSS